MTNLVKKIQENIFRYELFPKGAKIVVGVSGGPDSVCLLDILSKLKKTCALELIIAHVNYGLRGKDSDKDEELVRKTAAKYSCPVEVMKVKAPKNENIKKSEETLRQIRYDFFEDTRKKYLAGAIAVAHNRNDQAETVLMRILRGTGLRGLEAIRFKSNRVIRPILNISRKDILAYLGQNNISYRTDKTNLEVDFTRNKIRNKLFPYLEKEFNPNIQQNLFKFSESAASDYDFIRRYAGEWLAASSALKVSELNRLHGSIRREVLRQAIEKFSPNLRDIESSHMNEISKILKSSKSKRQKISLKSLKIERIGDKLIIKKSS